MLGKIEMSLDVKQASSQLGTYIHASVTGVLKRDPVTIINRPYVSDMDSLRVNCIFLWINIAVPLDLLLNCRIVPPMISLVSYSLLKPVSCKKAVSVFNFLRFLLVSLALAYL